MTTANNTIPIKEEMIFHIYNRAIGNEKLFLSDRDHFIFLDNIKFYVLPHASLYAYCLLPNHFHFLMQVGQSADKFSKGMSDSFNAYAKYFNTKYSRRGGLFMSPFKRKPIENDASLTWITWYIHRNPLHHKLTSDWQGWLWSSYKAYTGNYKTLIKTSFLIDVFGGRNQVISHHQANWKGWIDQDME